MLNIRYLPMQIPIVHHDEINLVVDVGDLMRRMDFQDHLQSQTFGNDAQMQTMFFRKCCRNQQDHVGTKSFGFKQ